YHILIFNANPNRVQALRHHVTRRVWRRAIFGIRTHHNDIWKIQQRMRKGKRMNLDQVVARRFEPIHQSYDWRDCALYAISLGIGDDPVDENELAYVYEGYDQLVVPSMCVVLGWPPLWIAEQPMAIAWTRVLHGEQRFTLHRPLAVAGSIRAE